MPNQPTWAETLAAGMPCLLHPARSSRSIGAQLDTDALPLLIRTGVGLQLVHWQCAAFTTWPTDRLRATLQRYSDNSAAVVVGPYVLERDMGTPEEWALQERFFIALNSRATSPADRAAACVYLATLIAELET